MTTLNRFFSIDLPEGSRIIFNEKDFLFDSNKGILFFLNKIISLFFEILNNFVGFLGLKVEVTDLFLAKIVLVLWIFLYFLLICFCVMSLFKIGLLFINIAIRFSKKNKFNHFARKNKANRKYEELLHFINRHIETGNVSISDSDMEKILPSSNLSLKEIRKKEFGRFDL